MKHKKGQLHHLKQVNLGLVTVMKQHYRKAIKILKNSGIVGGSIDPCLYMKKSAKGIGYIVLYVDNNLMIGNVAAIDNATEGLKNKGLVLKIVEGLQDYLSCKIKFSEDKKRAWLRHLHLIKNMEKQFGKLVQDVWSHKTPGTPKFLIVRSMVESEKISVEDQQAYQFA